MTLTNRDGELLKVLSEYGMFSTSQINKLYFAGVNSATVLRRLRILEEEKYLQRLGKLETNECLWGVTRKGGDYAGAENFKVHWSKSMLEHDHKLVKLRLLIEELGISRLWLAEHKLRSMIYKKYSQRDAKNKLIPDGLMEVSIKNYKESISIELELSLKNISRYQKIIHAYQGKEDLHAVWYIVNSKAILNCIKDYWYKNRSRWSKVKVYFTDLEEIKTLGVNAMMVGLDATYLIKNYFDLTVLPAQWGALVLSTPDSKINQLNLINSANSFIKTD